MTLDIPNAFMQIDISDNNSKKIIIKIRDSLVDILLEIDKEKHRDFMIYCGKDKLLYVKMLKALWSILTASILYYKKFRKDIEAIEHEANPYDMHVDNKIISSKQYTLAWHVDDVKTSNVNPEANTRFIK